MNLTQLALAMGITLGSSGAYSQENNSLARILEGDSSEVNSFQSSSSLDYILAASDVFPARDYLPETGDIIAQRSTSLQSKFIEEVTHSSYTHMGIVVVKYDGAYVLEAVGPVKYTKLNDWINRGYQGRYTVVRVNPDLGIDLNGVVKDAERSLGKPYDFLFGQDDKKIYCSELVQKSFEEGGIALGEWQEFSQFLKNSSPQVNSEIKRRWGKVPDKQKVVTPASIINSPFVSVVYTDF